MELSDAIALAALAVSIAVFARSELAQRAERVARKREDERRDEEVSLLRQQVKAALEQRFDERRAILVGGQGVIEGGSPVDVYAVSLVNGGLANALDVTAWLANENGARLDSSEQRLGALLTKAAEPLWFKLGLSAADSRGAKRIFLRAAWADGTGRHEENIVELRPLR